MPTPWEKHEDQTLYCFCDSVWRGKARIEIEGQNMRLVTEKPCPGCGKCDNLRKASSDPETWHI